MSDVSGNENEGRGGLPLKDCLTKEGQMIYKMTITDLDYLVTVDYALELSLSYPDPTIRQIFASLLQYLDDD